MTALPDPPASMVPLAAAVVCRGRSEAQRAYLMQCAGLPADASLPPLDPEEDPRADVVDAILDRTWRARTKADRLALGQVFTPRPVARQVLLELPLGPGPSVRILDPACGGGIFLIEAAAWLAASLSETPGLARAWALWERIAGVDIDPGAAALARLLLGSSLVDALGDEDPGTLPLPQVWLADALNPETEVLIEAFAPTHVLGNPPYLEAKRMPNPDRARLRTQLPELTGAFDLYMAFCHLALRWVGPTGVVALVLPNKVQVARYAASLRATLTASGRLHALLDLSELAVFARIGVYPIVVILGPERALGSYKACHRVASLDAMGRAALVGVDVPHELPLAVMQPPTWFTLPNSAIAALADDLLERCPRLEAVATVRSTCSFHRKGLRERFVKDGEALPRGIPYLGGRSWSRRNEIRPYQVDWTGHRIDFDAEALRTLRNPLPPLECFMRPKVIFCQHARTLIAYGDVEGRFVTKDVFPIVLPHDDSPEAVCGLTAILNSRLMSVLYATWFRGIQISGGYLHFLPVYLRRMPVPAPERWTDLAEVVAGLQTHPDEAKAEEIDARVMEAYALSPEDSALVRRLADHELGFAPAMLARR
ncbi:MAG: N-6 DNA methylase [Myxococcota bacterium]